jgi:hypothetical protein
VGLKKYMTKVIFKRTDEGCGCRNAYPEDAGPQRDEEMYRGLA